MKRKLAIMVGGKGRGSNMANLIKACRHGSLQAEPVVVIGTRSDSPAMGLAQELGVRTLTLSPKSPEYAAALLKELSESELVCLAGFMNLIPAPVLDAYHGPILNIHPSLLPRFGGKGMYGHHVHEAVIAAGETSSGCTVHLVTEKYDEGEIVLQSELDVDSTDTPETLAAKVLRLEHETYPKAVAKVLAEWWS